MARVVRADMEQLATEQAAHLAHPTVRAVSAGNTVLQLTTPQLGLRAPQASLPAFLRIQSAAQE